MAPRQVDRVLESSPIAGPRQRRGKSLMRRTYQKGYVYQRNHSEVWDPNATAYVQFWRDVPGVADPKRDFITLGICRTRTIAERKAAEKLEPLGINSAQTFIEATSSITFRQQGEIWLKSLANRKRNPLEQTTIDNRQYALDKWIYPFFDDRLLADVNNRAMKEFVEHISKLAPATIRDYSNIVKGVVASAINENGEELFPRKWNEEYIDAPIVEDQNQPSTNSDGVSAVLIRATGQHKALYALLAGCGPLRVGEALGLEIRHISSDCRTLRVEQKAKAGEIQSYLKTKNGEREIDLCTPLAAMLRDFIGTRTSGLVFHSETGNQLLQSNILRRNFHPILAELKHVKGGFNIFRRFRITHLEKSDCPEALKHFWSGHAPAHVSGRYVKLLTDRDYRLDWAEKIGTGFDLPSSIGKPGKLHLVCKSA
jgi:integrase